MIFVADAADIVCGEQFWLNNFNVHFSGQVVNFGEKPYILVEKLYI